MAERKKIWLYTFEFPRCCVMHCYHMGQFCTCITKNSTLASEALNLFNMPINVEVIYLTTRVMIYAKSLCCAPYLPELQQLRFSKFSLHHAHTIIQYIVIQDTDLVFAKCEIDCNNHLLTQNQDIKIRLRLNNTTCI